VNILLFSDGDLVDKGRIRVSDRRLTHLRDVHGATPGDSVRVGLIGGARGDGSIVTLDDNSAEITFSLDQPPPDKLPLTLVLALPRPKMLRRILRTVGECGVRELHLINSYKVEKSFWQSPLLAEDTLRDYLLQGLEQASDTIVPEVQLHTRFKPFAEDLLPTLAADRDAVVAHPGRHPGLRDACSKETLLVIGPEGGFIPYEVDKCQEAGCRPVSLGPRVLRVETAVAAALGTLLAGTADAPAWKT
jgi:RsmE family RNA methyltransferase